ncbi:MAG: response regulator [Planctomycetota bacterium]|nr:response regulator [Planctomycetota bacterium]
MSRRALIVDDEPHIRRVAELALRAVDCTVVSVSNGEEAWHEIQANCPDIVVSDVQMPKLDGLQLLRLIRTTPEYASLPVILLTAKGYELLQSDSGLLDTCDIIHKPFSPAALSRRVHETLSARVAAAVTKKLWTN